MKNKHPNLSFVAIVVIFVLVIVLGLVTLNRPDLTYQLSTGETLDQVILNEEVFYPEELVGIIGTDDPAYAIIDIRNPYEYIKGHINGAINIPSNSLLDKENLRDFDEYAADSVTVILYGQTQLEANGPWMILKQLGYDNFRVLMGGYHYFTTGPLDFYDMPEIPAYLVEEPAYDFYGIMEEMGSAPVGPAGAGTETQVVVPTRKKKQSAAEGGC